MEPDLGRFNRGVNRPKSGSHMLFFLYPQFPLVTVGYNQSPKSGSKTQEASMKISEPS